MLLILSPKNFRRTVYRVKIFPHVGKQQRFLCAKRKVTKWRKAVIK
jgi:hypothetical protein